MQDDEPSQESSQPDPSSSATTDAASKQPRRTSVKAATTRVSKAQNKYNLAVAALSDIVEEGEALPSIDAAFAKKLAKAQTNVEVCVHALLPHLRCMTSCRSACHSA